MKKSIVRKGLVLGIIVLFVGASVVPGIGGKQENKDNMYKLITEIKKRELKEKIREIYQKR